MANLQGGIGGAAQGAAAGSAILPGVGTVLGGIAGGIAGLFGGGESDYEKQQKILEQISAEIDAIPLPTLEAQELVLEKYRSAGILTPEMETVVRQGPSALEQVTTDPRLKQAQMGALAKLQQIGQEGFTPEQEAEANALSRQIGQQEQARQQSILREMQQRGVGGSGAELAAQLSSSQAAAERQAQEAEQIKAQAYKNALSAISQSGQLSDQLRRQDFDEQYQKASAADVINAANVANARAVQQRNVGSRNAAQETNLANKQSIMNQNVGLSNQQQMYNKKLLQQQYDNQMDKARAKTSAMGGEASAAGAAGKRADESTAAMMSGIATATPAIYSAVKGPAQYDTKTGEKIQKFDPYTGKPV